MGNRERYECSKQGARDLDPTPPSQKGLVAYTIKCPNCGAPLKLPEKGKEIKCEYCGATVYAEDMLKKLKLI